MSILRQIKFEIRNIIKSKFLLIFAILIVVVSIAVPIIGVLTQTETNNGYYPPVYYAREEVYADAVSVGAVDIMPVEPGKDNMESIEIDGVTIYADNPFFWQLQSLLSEQESLSNGESYFQFPASVDLMIGLIEQEIQYYLPFAVNVTDYSDYRMELSYSGVTYVYDKYFYEHNDVGLDVLTEVVMYRKGMDPAMIESTYINITAEQKLAAIDKADANIAKLRNIVENNDFAAYIDVKIQISNDQIADYEKNIEIQEQALLDNPDQEDSINQIIEEYRRQIALIKDNTIPLLEYRLEKNIIPGLNIWQNTAISDIENARSQLAYLVIMSEEEWNESQGGGGPLKEYYYYGEYDSYQEYVSAMQKQIDNLNKMIIIAQKSLDSDRPDMKYVPNGARSKTVGFLQYSLIVALFGVLLGGWLIASEYQQGTIRLLMIRPKTRTKILLSKFAAAIAVWLAVDVIGMIVNLVVNGICFGFADFGFPNYSVAGETGFLAYFLPQFLACVLPILFLFSLAFMIAVLVRNVAIAIAVPIVFFVGSFIVTTMFTYSPNMGWLAYTPIPFLMMASLFNQQTNMYYYYQTTIDYSIPLGVAMLLFLSAVFTVISVLVFKKRDITN